jgi:RNA polymerase sigma factor (sigma-70 family)
MMPAVQPMTTPQAESSLTLLILAQGGDGDALDQLLARYLPRLRRWASGRLPDSARSMLDTGDLVQEAVIAALRHLDTLEIRTEGALQFYLRRAVNNRIIDLYRRAGRRPRREALPDDVAAPDPSPLEALIGVEAMERYERALERLREEDRHAIVLRIELGNDYEATAAALNKPSADAARMAVARALARLADEMRRERVGDLRNRRHAT